MLPSSNNRMSNTRSCLSRISYLYLVKRMTKMDLSVYHNCIQNNRWQIRIYLRITIIKKATNMYLSAYPNCIFWKCIIIVSLKNGVSFFGSHSVAAVSSPATIETTDDAKASCESGKYVFEQWGNGVAGRLMRKYIYIFKNIYVSIYASLCLLRQREIDGRRRTYLYHIWVSIFYPLLYISSCLCRYFSLCHLLSFTHTFSLSFTVVIYMETGAQGWKIGEPLGTHVSRQSALIYPIGANGRIADCNDVKKRKNKNTQASSSGVSEAVAIYVSTNTIAPTRLSISMSTVIANAFILTHIFFL